MLLDRVATRVHTISMPDRYNDPQKYIVGRWI